MVVSGVSAAGVDSVLRGCGDCNPGTCTVTGTLADKVL